MKIFHSSLLYIVGSLSICQRGHAFAPMLSRAPSRCSRVAASSSSSLFMFKEYSETSSEEETTLDELEVSEEQKYQTLLKGFRALLDEVIHVNKRENLPRICTRNIELLTSMSGGDTAAICKEIMDNAIASQDQALIDNTEAAIQYVVYFVETFVAETKSVDDANKALLGEIIKRMIGRTTLTEKIEIEDLPSESERERDLNEFIAQYKDDFTPGFLRHLEGECKRIQNAPQNTPESMKLLEIIRMIQTRIIEELGQDLGEGAQVLGQLIGYECKEERLAVLEAGLTVRGPEFASELNAMTLEALEGFEKVIGGADPALVAIIQEINDSIQVFIASHDEK